MKEIKHIFESPAAMYETAGTPKARSAYFTGATVEEIHARRWGWVEGIKMLEALPEWKAPPAPGARWVKTWSDYDGDDLDPARMMDGAPCLSRRIKDTGRRVRGIVRVIVNIAQGCHTAADAMLWKAYAAARLVDSMEAAGQRCEIYAAMYAKHGYTNGDAYIETKIKAAADPLNVALCLNMFAPWALRYWYLGIMDTTGKATPGHGGAWEIADRPDAAGAIIIDCDDCLSRGAAAGFIQKNITTPGARV